MGLHIYIYESLNCLIVKKRIYYFIVPSQAPRFVSGVPSPNAITVTWTKPVLQYLYGSVSGYKVIIHSVNEQQGENFFSSTCFVLENAVFRTVRKGVRVSYSRLHFLPQLNIILARYYDVVSGDMVVVCDLNQVL